MRKPFNTLYLTPAYFVILSLVMAGTVFAQMAKMTHSKDMSSQHMEGKAIHVMNPWVRAVPPNSPSSAAYMTLRNTGKMDDELLSVKTSLARYAEIHTVVKKGNMMEMKPLGKLLLPAGKYVELQSGGTHIMLINLGHALQVGEMVELILTFRHAGEIIIKAKVAEGQPMQGMKGMEDMKGMGH